jgi:hypothetical protein
MNNKGDIEERFTSTKKGKRKSLFLKKFWTVEVYQLK